MRSNVGIAALLWAVIFSAPRAHSAQAEAETTRAEDLALPTAPIPYTRLRRPTAEVHRIEATHAARVAHPISTVQTPPGSPVSQVVGAVSPSELEAFVDGEVRRSLDEGQAPGAVVSVVQNGRVVLSKGYGLAATAPRRPVDPRSTLFRLGSVSKVFTWVEVMKAVSIGRLRLEAPINEFLPKEARVPNEGFAAPVRLEQLVAHTAGFESRDFGRLFVRSPDVLAALPDMLARWRPRRVREPGEVYAYSNYGAALAGEAAAYSQHRAFDDLVESDIFRPAGMASTSFREPHSTRDDLPSPMAADLSARLAQGFTWSRRGLVRTPFAWASGLAPAVSGSSTGADMAMFMQAWLSGGVASNRARLWDARTQALLDPVVRSSDAVAPALMLETLPGGAAALSQDGAVPGFRAKVTLAPTLALGVFVAANGESAGRLTSRLADDIVARFYSGAPHASGPVGDDLQRVTGLYLTTRRAYHGLEGFVDRLTALSSVKIGDAGIAVTRHDRTRVYRAAGGARFTDSDGVVRLTFVGNSLKPAAAFAAPLEEGFAERVDGLHHPRVLGAAAAAAALAAAFSLVGLFYRTRSEAAREAPAQAFSSRTQVLAACLLLGSLVAFAVFLDHAQSSIDLALNWPDPWLVGASWAALGFGLLTLVQIVLLRRVWRGSRRLAGWSAPRRLRHTTTVVIFAAFTFVAAAWGALEPWAT